MKTEKNIILLLDFEEDLVSVQTLDIRSCRKSVFLIGCYRSKDKKQIEWITGESTNRSVTLYNVRSSKSRNGWVNTSNPKVTHPDVAILYDLENPTNFCAYKIKESKEMTEREMADSGYPNPQGAYLVYTLSERFDIQSFDINLFLANYKCLQRRIQKVRSIMERR